MEDNIFDKIEEVDLKKKMEESYIDYAMSVIAARALPDVRDGLKPVNKSQHQSCDMRTIHIGIRHDNNLMIPQLADIKVLMNSGSECGNHRFDFGVGKNLVQTGFFYVQNLAAQGKDRLRRTASRLLCRASASYC